jgi:transposase-like protein
VAWAYWGQDARLSCHVTDHPHLMSKPQRGPVAAAAAVATPYDPMADFAAEVGRESTNVRNGSRSKTVVSDAAGEVEIEVPRDRESTFEPQIVKKRQRCLSEVDEVVLSLYAKGLTTGEISAHFDQIYGASVSKETISRITDKVVAEMSEWASRSLDSVYVAVFIDAIVVKVRVLSLILWCGVASAGRLLRC